MGYVPYTGGKDYFEEPNSGNDLILQFSEDDNGDYVVTAIEETDIPTLGLAPPSSVFGVAEGKVYDLIKVHVPGSSFTLDTTQLFTSVNSKFPSLIYDTVRSSLIKAWARSIAEKGGSGSVPISILVGKILRVDIIPTADGKISSTIVTLLMYVK